MHRVRERLVRARTALTNEIRDLLLEYGIAIPKGIYKLYLELPNILAPSEERMTSSLQTSFLFASKKPQIPDFETLDFAC